MTTSTPARAATRPFAATPPAATPPAATRLFPVASDLGVSHASRPGRTLRGSAHDPELARAVDRAVASAGALAVDSTIAPAVAPAVDGTVAPAVDPALDRALAVMGSAAATAALTGLLAERSVDGVLLRGGHLMSEGYPVELTFSTVAPGTARWTADVVPPSCPPGRRLVRLLGALYGHGVRIPPSPALELLAGAQHAADQRFGAWAGGRHDATGDRYKLYVEVPRDRVYAVGTRLARLLGRRPRLLDQSPLRFVGLDLATGGVELYHRIGPSDRRDLETILGAEALGHRTDDLLDALAQACGRPLGDRLPIANLGASVAVGPAGSTVALFAHTVSVLGRDRACRARVLRLAADRGLDLGRYADVSAGLTDTPPTRRHHSMLTLAVAEQGPVHIGIGLRPTDHAAASRAAE